MGSVYQARKLEKDIWSIEENGVRSLLILGDSRAMLVDTGFGTGDLRTFVGTLTDLPLFVVNTHADSDHIGCNGQFDTVWMHPAEFDRYFQKRRPEDRAAVRPLWEGDKLELGTRTFEVLLIPGHTPGSIALLDRANGLLLSGDSVQTAPVFLFGPGRNLPAYLLSLEKLDQLSTGVEAIYPAHGEIPLPADAIRAVREGALQLQRGELTGRDPGRDLPCRHYVAQGAQFLY